MVKNNKKNQLRLMTIVIHVESSTTQQKEKKRGGIRPSRKSTRKYPCTSSPKNFKTSMMRRNQN